MSRITPSAMFFVPSVNGISHNPNELTHDRDVINGGNVVLHTLLNIVESLPWS
jgi:N-carbamoyl-L-amino-acid hydrolase